MKRILSNLLFLLIILTSSTAFGQLSTGGIPASARYGLSPVSSLETITVAAPDMKSLEAEDVLNPTPYRFAVLLPADIEPAKTGTWTIVPGGRVWRVGIAAPGALALSAYFDRIYFREGEAMFLYPPDKSTVLGAFTSLNNTDDGRFATSLLYGDHFILEFYQPSSVTGLPDFHLNEIGWAYRGVGNMASERAPEGSAGNCEVNVECPEGKLWMLQKQGVVRIQVKKAGQLYWCSGSLINNTMLDRKPYILTADHCGFAATTTDLTQWIFYFDYEAPSCVFTGVIFPNKSITGAKLKAHGGNSGDNGSDFYLVLLNQSVPDSFNAYYNGWNRKDTVFNSGVGIHHPQGDVKKISTYFEPLVSTNYIGGPVISHWKVIWGATTDGHGVTEGGSSGSPIFDHSGRIIGTLTGGFSNCDSASLNSPDYYGKMSYSWKSNGSDSASRLDYWLDPGQTEVYSLNGIALSVDNSMPASSFTIYPNPFTDRLDLSVPEASSTLVIGIYDIIGSECYRKIIPPGASTPVTIYPSGLSQGIYILRVKSDHSCVSRKIIKQ